MENFEIHSIPKNTQEQQDKDIETTNEMQMNLAISIHPDKTEDEALLIFATSDEHVRFRKLVTDYPELIQKYKNKPEEILQTIKEKLYH